MKGYKYSEGEDVAHKDNLGLKMVVKRILRRIKEVKPKDGNPEHMLVQDRTFSIIGIECGWWEGNKLVKERFHSRELVPWTIVTQGEENVKQFLDSINNPEEYPFKKK